MRGWRLGLCVALVGVVARGEAPPPKYGKLLAVPFTEVKLQDAFWTPRIETNRAKTIAHNFAHCASTGRLSNFDKAAGHATGKFEGIFFNDSDVYKLLEGASYSLAAFPDGKLDRLVTETIGRIAAAQQPDGYLNSYFTLVEPKKRWTDFRVKHELYCAGHLIEGAVAHYRATGKRDFLDVAVRLADHIVATFGPDKRQEVPGHEEIELALVKLYQVTGQQKYFDLAKFFIDIRGDESKRKTGGLYHQDHMPVRQQSEIVGHAVRAMYLYCGAADVASYTGDKGLVEAMGRLWDDVVRHKMYVTGGIGARHAGEAFGDPYELPNDSAYCETCAAIGLAFWAHRLTLLHADAQYADVLERVAYNGILSGVALDGEKFFYVNPLASRGAHHRQPFFGCACCPPNVLRFLASLPGYMYAQGPDGVFVNLYAAGCAEVKLPNGRTLWITQKTSYPWDGRIELALQPQSAAAEVPLWLRIPGWCQGAKLTLNGQPVVPEMVRGYARLTRNWQAGDQVTLDLPMPVERLEAHPLVKADLGRVALQRGPIVYCFEAADNGPALRTVYLARDPQCAARHDAKLLGGVTVVEALSGTGRKLKAVPYYAWDHREPGEMHVWMRQDGKTRSPKTDDPAWTAKLYRKLDPATLGPSEPLTLMEMTTVSASFSSGNNVLDAVCDGVEPKDSCDHEIPRFTWWDHRGTKEWIQYEFPSPQKLSAASVYWFDDEKIKRHCRVPKSWQLLYREAGQWKPVRGASAYGVAKDKYNRVTFEPVTSDALRLEVELNPPWSGGILEWKVE